MRRGRRRSWWRVKGRGKWKHQRLGKKRKGEDDEGGKHQQPPSPKENQKRRGRRERQWEEREESSLYPQGGVLGGRDQGLPAPAEPAVQNRPGVTRQHGEPLPGGQRQHLGRKRRDISATHTRGSRSAVLVLGEAVNARRDFNLRE